jgi:uncharacterized protein
VDDYQVFVKPVGAACNMTCSYCYYLEKHNLYTQGTKFLMPDDLLEEYIIQHINACGEPELFFSWHGGEPLLAGLQFFQRVVELQQKHNPGNLIIINGLQTNGTLINEEWCRFMKRENFVVGISLDGPDKFHSINRFRKGGQSCYKETLKGHQLLKENEIPCEILCVVHSANVDYPLETYRFFKQLEAQYITFLPLVERRTSIGNEVTEQSVNAKAFGEFLCAIFEEWKDSDIGEIKIQIFEEALRTAFNQDHTLCIFKKICGGVPSMEFNGDVYSCDHYVRKENFLGNIRNISLQGLVESPAQKAFGKLKFDALPDYCLECEVLELCNGACPKDRFIQTSDGKVGLNYLCEGYKLFFKHCKPFVDQVAEVWQSNQ